MKVLCVTHSNDHYNTNKVMDHLHEMGFEAVRFDTDRLLNGVRISRALSGAEPVISLAVGDEQYQASDFSVVWFRKLWSPTILETIDESYRENVAAEVRSSLFGFFNIVESEAYCLNKMSDELRVERDKFLQLTAAGKAGLNVPETLITSDPDELSAFFEAHGNCIIAKLHYALSFSVDRPSQFFPTTEITNANVEHLKDTLAYCPMIFQRKVAKAFELRIVYVNGTCLTGKINATASDTGKIDWRNADETLGWEPYELPSEIGDQLRKMMQFLELGFGVIDMIVTPENEFVFLEVNPSGEWGMLERDLELPIAETIAKALMINYQCQPQVADTNVK